MKLPFFESRHCQARVHCRTCRDRVGGRRWRTSINEAFDIPDGPDFVCPYGAAWGDQDGPPASPAPTPRRRRRRILPRLRPPGDVLRSLIHHATCGRVRHGVGCELFRQDMNAWGWRGCLRRWRSILSRCRDQAAAEGIPDPLWFWPVYLLIAAVHRVVGRSRGR